MPPPKIVVFFSGGIDSSCLVNKLLKDKREVWPVYVRCGLPWEDSELFWAKKFLRAIRQDRLKPLLQVQMHLDDAYRNNWSHTGKTPEAGSRDQEVFLPARNILLIIKALLALSANNIWKISIATLQGNPFPDGKISYFKSCEKILSKSFNHTVNIEAPFRKLTKKQIMLIDPHVPLSLTFSCIDPKNNRPCGNCNKCEERKKALSSLGVNKNPYKHDTN